MWEIQYNKFIIWLYIFTHDNYKLEVFIRKKISYYAYFLFSLDYTWATI